MAVDTRVEAAAAARVAPRVSPAFALGGLPLVRGHLTNFPALLMPLLTAPAWLFHDVGTSFRVIQAMEVLAMSLAAVPAYLLARRLRLGTNAALAVAALTLAVPNFLS